MPKTPVAFKISAPFGSSLRRSISKKIVLGLYFFNLKMCWQAYVDTNLLGTGKVNKAGIFGVDGSPWAISPGFSVSKENQLTSSLHMKDFVLT